VLSGFSSGNEASRSVICRPGIFFYLSLPLLGLGPFLFFFLEKVDVNCERGSTFSQKEVQSFPTTSLRSGCLSSSKMTRVPPDKPPPPPLQKR